MTDPKLKLPLSISKKHTGRMIAARAAVIENTEGRRGIKGRIDCPSCEGQLAYSVSESDGHIWGRCSTKECVEWLD